MAPTFGVVFSGDFPLQRTLEGAVLAERLGFDACWLGEDFFYHGGIATATAVAERTERMTIGLGVLSPLPRHPALTAMEVATLDEIAEGRLILGIGNAGMDAPDAAHAEESTFSDARRSRAVQAADWRRDGHV